MDPMIERCAVCGQRQLAIAHPATGGALTFKPYAEDRVAELEAEVARLTEERDRANNDRGVLIQTQRALTKRATDAEATVARLTARVGAIRAETIEKCARIADSYGRVWKDRPGPATANAIAEKIRAALGPAGQEVADA